MSLLRALRAEQIEMAQRIAERLIAAHGITNSREVWLVMRRDGLLDARVKDHWLGCIFRDKRFKWTGEYVLPPLPEGTSIHAQRPVKVWGLSGV